MADIKPVKQRKPHGLKETDAIKGMYEPVSSFINIYTDGSVRIDGGLLFRAGPFSATILTEGNAVTNHYHLSHRPRWYQLGAWWRIIKLICSYVPVREERE